MNMAWLPAQSNLDGLADALRDEGLGPWDFGRAAIIIAVAVVAARAGRLIVARMLGRRGTDAMAIDLVGRIVSYAIVLFGCIYSLEAVGVAIGPVLGALGIAGFAIAFALQDVTENFVAGLILQAGRPFNASDEIVTGDFEGLVMAVDARSVTIQTPDGETVRVPSADVAKSPIINHTQVGQRRSTVEIGVAYGTDLDRARSVAVEAVRAVDSVLDDPNPEALLFRFGESSIDIAVRFWHGPTIAQTWNARNDVVLALDVAFKANGMTIPFPQRTVHLPAAN